MRRVRDLLGGAAAPLLVASAVLAPLAVHWLAGRTVVWFDSARLYAPERWLVDQALRSFRLPLWNPFLGGGMPLFADAIHGVLHPVSILAAWLRTDRAVDVMIGGHVVCAGLGAGLLARELGTSRTGATVAAFAYGMSGFVLSMAGNLVFLAGAGALPLCVAGLRRFAADPRPASLAGGVAGAAILALSGDVQTSTIGGALALALAWQAAGWRGALRALVAGAVGLLVAGVQLVPSAVHLPRSERTGGTWSPSPLIWAFEPWRLPELVLPGFLWGSDPFFDRVYAGLAGAGRWIDGSLPVPFAASVSVGLVPLALAAVGVREGPRGRLLAAAALVLLWIALGPALGASAVLGHVPLWKAFRYSEKLVGPLTLVLAVLAALGTDGVVERRVGARRVLAVAAALALASVAVCWLEASRLAPAAASVAEGRVARGAWHVLCAAAALGGWLLLRERLGRAARVAFAALVWAGMAAASPAALRPGEPGARLRTAGPSLAADSPGPRIVTPYTYEPLHTDRAIDWIDQSVRDCTAKGYVAYNVRSRLDSLDDYGAMIPRRLAHLRNTLGPRWAEAARRYAPTHVLVDPPRSEDHRAVHAMATSGGTRVDSGDGIAEVWAIPHREWASFPREVRVVDGEEAAVVETARAFFAQGGAVVVEAASAFSAAPGRVLSLERGVEGLRIEADATADATLVVADAWWPGWEATLDGLDVPIFPADALVRAVRWPAGRHVLEMRYRPPEVRTGIVVSGVGLVALGIGMALLRRPRPE